MDELLFGKKIYEKDGSACFPFMIKLNDEIDNCLKIIISLPRTGENKFKEENTAVASLLENCTELVPDYDKIYEICFERYVMYQIKNESFTFFDDAEQFEGDYLRIYKKSKLLNNIGLFTDYELAQIFLDGEAKHYGIITQNHVIDIIAVYEPTIKKIENE